MKVFDTMCIRLECTSTPVIQRWPWFTSEEYRPPQRIYIGTALEVPD